MSSGRKGRSRGGREGMGAKSWFVRDWCHITIGIVMARVMSGLAGREREREGRRLLKLFDYQSSLWP